MSRQWSICGRHGIQRFAKRYIAARLGLHELGDVTTFIDKLAIVAVLLTIRQVFTFELTAGVHGFQTTKEDAFAWKRVLGSTWNRSPVMRGQYEVS
jgi:hypothetical protein